MTKAFWDFITEATPSMFATVHDGHIDIEDSTTTGMVVSNWPYCWTLISIQCNAAWR